MKRRSLGLGKEERVLHVLSLRTAVTARAWSQSGCIECGGDRREKDRYEDLSRLGEATKKGIR